MVKDQEFLDKYSDINFTTDINDIYSKCDVISLHLPHTKQTDKLINNIVINKKLKKQPIIINTSRGRLIDPMAIISGLKNNLIKWKYKKYVEYNSNIYTLTKTGKNVADSIASDLFIVP